MTHTTTSKRLLTALPALLLVLALASAGCGNGADAGAGADSAAAAPSTPASDTPASAAPPAASTPAATPVAQIQFPPQQQLEKIVTAYTYASERPELITGLPCYCPCELYGHGGVIDCHRSQHAAMCDVCMDEAIQANEIFEAQLARGIEPDIAAVQAQVKDRYRRAVVANAAQQFPMMNTQQGQAFLQACSDCHQIPSPAMHTAGDWDNTLGRMEQYARGNGSMPDQRVWDAALSYVKSVAAQVPATNVAQMRRSLETTVEHLKETEGEAAYYPSVRDDVLDPAWARRMADAYEAARALPAELLAATPTQCKPCQDAGNGDLLSCLNSWQAITCETAIDEVEALVAEQSR
jgi:cytochrome c2